MSESNQTGASSPAQILSGWQQQVEVFWRWCTGFIAIGFICLFFVFSMYSDKLWPILVSSAGLLIISAALFLPHDPHTSRFRYRRLGLIAGITLVGCPFLFRDNYAVMFLSSFVTFPIMVIAAIVGAIVAKLSKADKP